jgi:hypothetical protein
LTDPFQAKVDALIDDYLSVGCPCRFPRFRALAKRDTSGAAGGYFIGYDQQALHSAFERRAPIVGKKGLGPYAEPQPQFYSATCEKCGSTIERSSEEIANNAWVDWLVIRKKPEVSELGAPLQGKALRCRPLSPAGPGQTGMDRASREYPLVEEDEWFKWMRERV